MVSSGGSASCLLNTIVGCGDGSSGGSAADFFFFFCGGGGRGKDFLLSYFSFSCLT